MARLQKQHLAPVLIGVLMVVFLGFLWPAFRDVTAAAVGVGDEAPEFELLTETGQKVRLDDFRGKFLVLNFWATWCPPCVEEMPSLSLLSQQFAGKGVAVLGVSVDQDLAAYQQFLRKTGVRFLNVRDPDRRVSHSFGTYKYPETYFIDRRGVVVRKIIGKADWTDSGMLEEVDRLAAESR